MVIEARDQSSGKIVQRENSTRGKLRTLKVDESLMFEAKRGQITPLMQKLDNAARNLGIKITQSAVVGVELRSKRAIEAVRVTRLKDSGK